MRTRRVGMALVVDEFGSILGLSPWKTSSSKWWARFTTNLMLSSGPSRLPMRAYFDAALNVRDLDTQYNIALPEDPAYATVGGFVLDQLGFIPKEAKALSMAISAFSRGNGRQARGSRENSTRSLPETEATPSNAAILCSNLQKIPNLRGSLKGLMTATSSDESSSPSALW